MSFMMIIYTEECLTQDQVFDFVTNNNGMIQTLSDFKQGYINKDDANIWIYYRGNTITYGKEVIELLKNDFGINAKTEIAVDVGHNDHGAKLALSFCIKFLEKYPKSIVHYGEYTGYIGIKRLRELYNAPIIDY